MNTKLIEKIEKILLECDKEEIINNHDIYSRFYYDEAIKKIMDLFSSYKSQIIKECIESLPKKKTCMIKGGQKDAKWENYEKWLSNKDKGFNEAIDQIKNKLELLVKK